MSKHPSVCIINRNYPPVSGATGFHAHQLAQYLLSQEIEVHIVTTAQEKDQIQNDYVHYIKPLYNGTAKKLRLLSSYLEATRLITKALQLNTGYYIVMTDPPLLNYVAAGKMKRKQWILWTMDLFPDGFVANGLVTSQNRLFAMYQRLLRKNPPLLLISLGKQQAHFLKDNYYPNTPSIMWPIGLRNEEKLKVEAIRPESLPSWHKEGKTIIGYVGNLGEAHNPDAILWIAEAIDPELYILVVSCQGTHKKKIESALSTKDHVYIESHIPERLMSKIDIHIVILRSEWTHICVPSKGITAIQYGAAVLFFGSKESDTWKYVKACGWQVSTEAEIHEWATTLSRQQILEYKQEASNRDKQLKSELLKGWKDLSSLLRPKG